MSAHWRFLLFSAIVGKERTRRGPRSQWYEFQPLNRGARARVKVHSGAVLSAMRVIQQTEISGENEEEKEPVVDFPEGATEVVFDLEVLDWHEVKSSIPPRPQLSDLRCFRMAGVCNGRLSVLYEVLSVH